MAGVHEDWMERLEDRGLLDREIEFLPTGEELAARRRNHQGLTSPELSTLMSYTKIVLEPDEVLGSDLPDDPYLADRLVRLLPDAAARRATPTRCREHRLSREIITTVAGQRLRQPGRDHLLPPAVGGDRCLGRPT